MGGGLVSDTVYITLILFNGFDIYMHLFCTWKKKAIDYKQV